jgi:hypothetical protein
MAYLAVEAGGLEDLKDAVRPRLHLLIEEGGALPLEARAQVLVGHMQCAHCGLHCLELGWKAIRVSEIKLIQ